MLEFMKMNLRRVFLIFMLLAFVPVQANPLKWCQQALNKAYDKIRKGRYSPDQHVRFFITAYTSDGWQPGRYGIEEGLENMRAPEHPKDAKLYRDYNNNLNGYAPPSAAFTGKDGDLTVVRIYPPVEEDKYRGSSMSLVTTGLTVEQSTALSKKIEKEQKKVLLNFINGKENSSIRAMQVYLHDLNSNMDSWIGEIKDSPDQ